jgi:hypothetical protein
MARDQSHNALGGAIGTRQLGTPTGVVEISPERRVTGRETPTHAGGEPFEEDTRDAVPEQRTRWFRNIVEEARDDELLIRTQPAKDARGFGGMPVVRSGCSEISHCLLHPVTHAQKLGPRNKLMRN